MVKCILNQLAMFLGLRSAVDYGRLGEVLQSKGPGDAQAQFNLGDSYYYGIGGVPQNYAEVVKWWRKAAEQGYASAQYNLGLMYKNGEGVPEDDVEAAKWYRKAAEQGNAWAQYNLGWMYDNGEGVPKDDVEAAKWYHKAAGQGHSQAVRKLGYKPA